MRNAARGFVCALAVAGLAIGGGVFGGPAAAAPTDELSAKRAELDAYRAAGSLELSFPGLPWPATLPPPYIDRVEWAQTPAGPSLPVYPTAAGRRVTGWGVPQAAWREVLALDADGNTAGMRAQFDCHWVFARLVEPGKPSWNLEPGRPVVGPLEMIATACNPGSAASAHADGPADQVDDE
ncbi:DUF2599 domain-containing protein [Gordonia caeni]|uniref:DUF2599 domain-containing protein n=1 Tax=Gordonia caeni TaxID=1007097 RepID=A0ABP7NNN6_9ACTN